MKKYSEYKDSGIEWIGEIPIGWSMIKIKFLADYVKTGTTPPTDQNEYYENGTVDWFSPSDFKNIYLSNSKKKITELAIQEGKNRLYEKNTILLIGIGATVGKIGITRNECSSNQQINAIKFNESKMNPFFGVYYLSSIKDFIVKEADSSTLPIFNQTQTKELSCSCPPLAEQTIIANYLDRKTAEIDDLIAKKERLTDLYKEERIATINQAVTKGLDRTLPMKDSGIKWLGEIPEHWELKRLKYCIDDIFLGLAGKVDYVDNEENGVPLIRAGNLFGGEVNLDDVRYISFNQHKQLTKNRKVQKGDVLVTKSGSIGVCAIMPYEGEYSLYESVFAIRADAKILNNELLLFILNSHMLKHQYTSELAGMGVHHLNMGDMKNTIVIIPPIEEQSGLVKNVKDKLFHWDKLISRTTEEIKLLKEYKTALISEVVLGKVDVREEELDVV